MVYAASESRQQTGKLGTNNGFHKSNTSVNNGIITKNKTRGRIWKIKKKGNPANSATAMAIPHFNVTVPSMLQPPPYAVPGPPDQAFFPANAPAMETPFKNHVHPRNGLKKRRNLSRKKIYYPILSAPLAPRNTTSFIMRAKKLGGIAPSVTPSPATPAVLPTPLFSPGMRDKGSLEEMNKELGVDGYGSMNGLIRLRSYEGRTRDAAAASESESDVEQGDLLNEEESVHSVERLEQLIDQGLSRFEMIYPSPPRPHILENRVNNQERVIAHLEEENLTLKEKLFLFEQELNELRRRVTEIGKVAFCRRPC